MEKIKLMNVILSEEQIEFIKQALDYGTRINQSKIIKSIIESLDKSEINLRK